MASQNFKASDLGLVYGEGTEKLSQLSDIVSLSQDNDLSSQPPPIVAPLCCSQPGIAELQEQLPSQPLLPTPELPIGSQRIDNSGAREPDRPLSRFAEEQQQQKSMLCVPLSTESTPVSDTHVFKKRRITRRGPMDEMRQLVRILVKVIPHSAKNIKACEEGGGGNRISEEQIKCYLHSTVGDAPQPRWGVPEGWGDYLAELFSWVTGRPITRQQAMRCAKREPGRSWEAIESELAKLGVLPSTWPLPLSKSSLGSALVPAAQDVSSPRLSPVSKAESPRRSETLLQPEVNAKRQRVDIQSPGRYSEKEEVTLWAEALSIINTALTKAGTCTELDKQMTVAKIKSEIHSKTQHQSVAGMQVPSMMTQPGSVPFFMSSQAPQIVPISVAGPNGQLQAAFTLQLPTGGSSPPLEPTSSLDLGFLNPSQFLLSQPVNSGGSSAFQAVKPSSPVYQGAREKQSSQLLDAPPPLRLSQNLSLGHQQQESEPGSPSTEEEDNSAVFNPSQLASPMSGPASNLFKPTALKTDPCFLDRPTSQGESRSLASSPSAAPSGTLPVLGYVSNGQFVPLANTSSLQALPNPTLSPFQGQTPLAFVQAPGGMQTAVGQPTLSQALENTRAQQTSTWVPSLAASLQ